MVMYIKAYIIKKLIIKIEEEKSDVDIYKKKCTANYFSLIIMFVDHCCHEERIKKRRTLA